MPSKLTGSTCAIGVRPFSDRSASGSTKRCDADPDLPAPIRGTVRDLVLTADQAEGPMRHRDNDPVLSWTATAIRPVLPAQ